MINTCTGVMEDEAKVGDNIRKIIEMADVVPITVTVVENSPNHGNVPMLVIGNADPEDGGISIWNIEVSENGVFAYTFDDGVS